MLQDNSEWTLHVYPDNAQEYRWHLKSNNGRIIADSGEGYTREADCLKAMAKFKSKVASAKLVRHQTLTEKIAQALLQSERWATRLG